MYNIYDYGDMMADVGRIEAFRQALCARVRSDSVVLEIGAGAGTLTMLACQAGARKVYAIESGGIIQTAREMAAANGYSDRIEFIQGLSTEIELPEKVDVVLSDIAGVLPAFNGSLRAILDARDRFLKPDGVLIPERDSLCAAIVPARAAPRSVVDCWQDRFGLDCSAPRRRTRNTWRKWRADPASVVGESRVLAVIDYRHQQTPRVAGRGVWPIGEREAGAASGVCVWFDCQTASGLGFSNSPRSGEEHCYQQAFFPWPQELDLEAGDCLTVDIRADVVGEGYTWTWSTVLVGGLDGAPEKASFRQSEFLSAPASSEWQRKSRSTFIPAPNELAAIDRMILERLFAGVTLETIARHASEQFPRRFSDWRQALTRVSELSLRYSD